MQDDVLIVIWSCVFFSIKKMYLLRSIVCPDREGPIIRLPYELWFGRGFEPGTLRPGPTGGGGGAEEETQILLHEPL